MTKRKNEEIKNEIHDCQFYGVHYDAKAVEAIVLIAKGLNTNAEGLSKLADVLKASNVTIETLLKVDK